MDSPRGRIQLMGMVESGEVAMDDAWRPHLDRCLGCLACVPACPSGVRYDLLIERARVLRRGEAPGSPRNRVIDARRFAVLPRPRLLRAMSCRWRWDPPDGAGSARDAAADLRAAPPR